VVRKRHWDRVQEAQGPLLVSHKVTKTAQGGRPASVEKKAGRGTAGKKNEGGVKTSEPERRQRPTST